MNTILEQINSTGLVFVKFALPMLVQSAVLIVVLLLADLLLRKKVRAVFRYWLWMLVLLKLILPTTLSSPVSLGSWLGDKLATVKFSEMSTPVESVNLPQMIDTGTVAVTGTPQADIRPTVTRSPVAASLLVSPAPLTWQGIVFLVWVAVVVAMGLLLLQRAIFVTGLIAQAQNPTQLMNDAFQFCCGQMGAKGKVGLKVSANTASPAVCGLFRPVILVPQNLAPTLGSSRLRPVLLHELAHIKRGDLWINLVQTILQIIYFYNPLLWLANSIIRRIREQAVDEAVQVAMGANAPQYPQTLVDVAKLAFNRPVLSLRLIGVVESKSALKGRIERMLNRPIPKTAKLGILGLITILIFAAVLLPMAKAKEKQQAETKYSAVTVQEGVGFDDIIVGDANCTGEFIKSKLGEPDEENKDEKKGWWLNYRKKYGLDFWLNLQEDTLYEIRLNKGFKGKLRSGISMSSTKQDVFDTYGKPIREEVVEDLHQRYDNQVLLLFREPAWVYRWRKPHIAKIHYNEKGLLFWFDGDTIDQIVVSQEASNRDKFRATLPNGVTIKLIGVCEHPSEGKQWWRPDGSVMKRVPYTSRKGEPIVNSNEEFNRLIELAVGLSGADLQDVSLACKVPGATRTSANSVEIEGLKSIACEVSKLFGYGRVNIGVAVGSWETIGVQKANIKEIVEEKVNGGFITWDVPLEKDGEASIKVAHSFGEYDFRVIARDKNGTILKSPWSSGGGADDLYTTEYRFSAHLAQINEFQFQTRPYQWVTFSNVSLKPGAKTDVQVEIEGAGKVGDKNKMASKNSAAEGTSGKETEKIVEQAVMTISTCAETDPQVKKSLESLQGLDEQVVVKEIVKFLDSGKSTVRRSAIYILWKVDFKSIEPAELYLLNLCSHEEEYTRGMVALALGARKVEPAFDTLCNMTLNDPSAYARRCAAYALGLMGNPEAKDVLEKALKDSDFNVRNNAEAALTMLSQPEKPKSTQPEAEIKDRGREKSKTEVQ